MKKYAVLCFLISGAILSTNSLFASGKIAYLKISLGQVPGECSESNESLLQRAQFEGLH
ncbi:MAG: hypothetical protein HY390_04965 [Deltaproteobacteria bacterium]|nr:hypothetical protein [Deltaproteobacteria bacterium]